MLFRTLYSETPGFLPFVSITHFHPILRCLPLPCHPLNLNFYYIVRSHWKSLWLGYLLPQPSPLFLLSFWFFPNLFLKFFFLYWNSQAKNLPFPILIDANSDQRSHNLLSHELFFILTFSLLQWFMVAFFVMKQTLAFHLFPSHNWQLVWLPEAYFLSHLFLFWRPFIAHLS